MTPFPAFKMEKQYFFGLDIYHYIIYSFKDPSANIIYYLNDFPSALY